MLVQDRNGNMIQVNPPPLPPGPPGPPRPKPKRKRWTGILAILIAVLVGVVLYRWISTPKVDASSLLRLPKMPRMGLGRRASPALRRSLEKSLRESLRNS